MFGPHLVIPLKYFIMLKVRDLGTEATGRLLCSFAVLSFCLSPCSVCLSHSPLVCHLSLLEFAQLGTSLSCCSSYLILMYTGAQTVTNHSIVRFRYESAGPGHWFIIPSDMLFLL